MVRRGRIAAVPALDFRTSGRRRGGGILDGLLAQYDAIADAYRDSKRLPFRRSIERHTLFEALGDIRGMQVLDLACGEGSYSRRLRRAGAREVVGVDISSAMIRLAEQQERREPLGIRYRCQDAADFDPAPGAADRVVAMYLLHYAGSAAKLLRFCGVCWKALRPGGRLVGFNDNVLNPPHGPASWRQYGIEKTGPETLREGAPIRYRITNPDGRSFGFENFFLRPETYRRCFAKAGFPDFRWLGVSLHPDAQGDPFWDRFRDDPPVIAFTATKPEAPVS